MMRGNVNSRSEAILLLRIRGQDGAEILVESIIDTGFTGSLTLPISTVSTLGLEQESVGEALLADGSVRQYDLYSAEVKWGNDWRPILVSAIGDEALMGMRLLMGYQLVVHVVPSGVVEISLLP